MTPRLRTVFFLGLLLTAAPAPPAAAQGNAYLDLDGIPGEATAAGFQDQIEVTFSADNFAVPGPGVEARPIVIRKETDLASGPLWVAMAKASIIAQGTLTVQGPGPTTLYAIELQNVLVTDISFLTDSSGGPATELVSLWYTRITWIKGSDQICWDRVTQSVC